MATEKYLNKTGLKEFTSKTWTPDMETNLRKACEQATGLCLIDNSGIYISLDEEDFAFVQGEGHENILDCTNMTSRDIYATVESWYQSCDETRHIKAACTVDFKDSAVEGEITLVPQFCEGAFSEAN